MHAVRRIYNKDKLVYSKLLIKDRNALNVYKINIFQVLRFMLKAKHNVNPRVFDNTFTEIHHRYLTKFSRTNFKQPKTVTKTTSIVISSRESKIWNNYLHELAISSRGSKIWNNYLHELVISSHGSKIWNNYLHELKKKILSFPLFLNKSKNILESENELAF